MVKAVAQEYLTEHEQTEREHTQREQALMRTLRLADLQARYVADQLRPAITAEQAPLWTRIAELEKLRQAKMAQEQAHNARQTAQERLQTASQRQAALPPPTPEQPAAQKPVQTPLAPSQTATTPQPPLSAAQQVRADVLCQAFEILDKRAAMLRHPELTPLYPLVTDAARFAKEKFPDPVNRATFVAQIKEHGIQTLARGEKLPSLSQQRDLQPQREATQERKPGRSLGR